jgi:alkylation response protein AidB-like acyl-CoA dehydrogenase
VVLEEVGANAPPTQVLASALAVVHTRLHGTDDERKELLPRLAVGEVVPVTLGDVVLEPAARAETLDPTLRIARADVPVEVPPDVRDTSLALVSALQVGAMQRGLDMTVRYAKERVQFGRPIGSFQALKHRMADMLVLLEASRSVSIGAVSAAAAYLDAPGPDRAADLRRLAAVAAAYCSEALDHVAAETVQLHGGIAITWEHDAHLLFKRAHALSQLNGPAHRHRAAALEALQPSR